MSDFQLGLTLWLLFHSCVWLPASSEVDRKNGLGYFFFWLQIQLWPFYFAKWLIRYCRKGLWAHWRELRSREPADIQIFEPPPRGSWR